MDKGRSEVALVRISESLRVDESGRTISRFFLSYQVSNHGDLCANIVSKLLSAEKMIQQSDENIFCMHVFAVFFPTQ